MNQDQSERWYTIWKTNASNRRRYDSSEVYLQNEFEKFLNLNKETHWDSASEEPLDPDLNQNGSVEGPTAHTFS